MLEFDPNKRITASEAILNDYFDDIRLPEQENVAPPNFNLSIDDLERENLSVEQLKVLVCEVLGDLTSDQFDFTAEADSEGDDY